MSRSVEQVEESASSPVQPWPRRRSTAVTYPRRMRPPRPPLGLEIAAARGVAALSRRVGAGGGTTIPGKLLAQLDPDAIDRLAAGLPQGTALVSATNGKTTTAAMTAEILRPRHRLAHNAPGADLGSGGGPAPAPAPAAPPR